MTISGSLESWKVNENSDSYFLFQLWHSQSPKSMLTKRQGTHVRFKQDRCCEHFCFFKIFDDLFLVNINIRNKKPFYLGFCVFTTDSITPRCSPGTRSCSVHEPVPLSHAGCWRVSMDQSASMRSYGLFGTLNTSIHWNNVTNSS